MKSQPNNRLIAKVIIIGLAIAVLSYLFHPEAGQFYVTINGQPIADPLIQFAAIPTFLVFVGLTVILAALLLLGVGLLMFLGVSFAALLACALIAPYFWPVLLIIFLVIAIMSINHT